MSKKRVLSNLLIAVLLISYSMGIPFGRRFETVAQADISLSKISSDLRDLINSNPLRPVHIIIQTSRLPVLGLLTRISLLGGIITRLYDNLNALAVEVPGVVVSVLALLSDITYISLDRSTQVTGHLETTTGTDQARNHALIPGSINGSGTGIAILDSGIYSGHRSFRSAIGSASRVTANVDFTGEGRTDDPYGHGTHVAAIAAGGDRVSSGAYTGVTPAANIINVRVLDRTGRGKTSNALAGIDWRISKRNTYNIKVLNLSFGAAFDSYVNDPICKAVRKAFSVGLVVCVAAGNLSKDENGNKIYGAIHSPGIEPSAITVGAANTYGSNVRSDDVMTTYSSRGPTRGYYTDSAGAKHYDNLIKPDLTTLSKPCSNTPPNRSEEPTRLSRGPVC